MQHPAKNQLEWIRWRDACAASSRAGEDELAQLRPATNVNLGWVIDENDQRVVLAHGYSSSGEIDHFVIPTACILDRSPIIPPRRTKAERA